MPYRLPLPPSANALVRPVIVRVCCPRCGCSFRPRKGDGARETAQIRLGPTKEAEDFREKAHRRLPTEPIAGPVEMYLTVYVPSIASDGPNREKALADALNGRLFWDDKQVAEWHGRKVITDDPAKVGVVVEIRPADPVEHAELARRLASSSIQQRANEAAQPELFAEPTSGGPSMGVKQAREPLDARGGGGVGPPRPRAVLPEPLQQRLNRIAKPAVISPRREPDDEGPEAA